jgi:hypothetical protein
LTIWYFYTEFLANNFTDFADFHWFLSEKSPFKGVRCEIISPPEGKCKIYLNIFRIFLAILICLGVKYI